MQFQHSENKSVADKIVASFLVAFSMFMVSYTATRVYLIQFQPSQANAQGESNVIPHPASLWSDLSR